MTGPRRIVRRSGSAGFSLAELLVAMVVTMIVSGAIFGLLSGGQSAFRREPELIERQQNIRVAMDLIAADVRAGESFQGRDAQGPTTTTGTTKADDLWLMISAADDCPDVPTDKTNPVNGNGNSVNINTAVPLPNCYPEPGFYIIFYADGGAKIAWGHNIHSHDTKINFPEGQQPTGIYAKPLDCSVSDPSGTCPIPNSNPVRLGNGKFLKYQIAADATDGVPGLYRSESGGYNVSTKALSDPPSTDWQLVARGIEDMQVRFWPQNGTDFADAPGTGVVRQVEITLTGRTTQGNLQGGTGTAGTMRGNLRTVVTPRSGLTTLAATSPAPQYQ